MQKYRIQKCPRGYEILERVESNKPYTIWKYLKIYFKSREEAQEFIKGFKQNEKN